MTTVSERRIEANRRNACKSTGPVTDSGRARSSQNALKHGLAAENHLPTGLDPATFEADLKRWNDSLKPVGPAEEALVRTACHASWKLTRIAAVEEIKGVSAAAQAAGERTRAQTDRAEQIGRRLIFDPINRCAQEPLRGFEDLVATRRVDDPPRLVRELTSFLEGVEWLLARWDELRRILHEEGFWHYPEKIRAIRLLGRRPEDALNDPTVRRITLACQACHPGPIELPFEIDRCMIGADRAPLYYVRVQHMERFKPASSEAALADLSSVVDDEVSYLEALKTERLESLAALDRAAAEARAWIDTSSDSPILHRYETAAQRALHRSLDLLVKLRKAGAPAADADPQPLTGQPVATSDVRRPAAPQGVEDGNPAEECGDAGPGGREARGATPTAPNEPKAGGRRSSDGKVRNGRKPREDAEAGGRPPA